MEPHGNLPLFPQFFSIFADTYSISLYFPTIPTKISQIQNQRENHGKLRKCYGKVMELFSVAL